MNALGLCLVSRKPPTRPRTPVRGIKLGFSVSDRPWRVRKMRVGRLRLDPGGFPRRRSPRRRIFRSASKRTRFASLRAQSTGRELHASGSTPNVHISETAFLAVVSSETWQPRPSSWKRGTKPSDSDSTQVRSCGHHMFFGKFMRPHQIRSRGSEPKTFDTGSAVQ